jgi:hypothetical protein
MVVMPDISGGTHKSLSIAPWEVAFSRNPLTPPFPKDYVIWISTALSAGT